MDFFEYLLNYTERYFTKVTDLANIILALVSSIVAIVAVELALSPNNLALVLSTIGILLVLLFAIIKLSITNYNKFVYDIEECIFQYYTSINKKTENEQLDIFKKLHTLFGNRKFGFSSKPSPSEREEFKKMLAV